MPILTFPAIVPSRCEWSLLANTQTFVSPLNRSAQTVEMAGAVWRASVEFEILNQAQWRDLAAFLAQMRGQAGRCYFGPPHARIPLGVATGSPLVNGAGQAGSALATDGWTPSVAGILKRGDYFAFDSGAARELHMLTADADSNGAGAAALSFSPPIRTPPADNAAIAVQDPSCIMRVAGDGEGALRVRPPLLAAVSLSLVESFF